MFIYVLGDQCLLQRLYNIRYLHRVSLLYGLFSLKVTPSCKGFTTLVTFLGFSAVCVRLWYSRPLLPSKGLPPWLHSYGVSPVFIFYGIGDHCFLQRLYHTSYIHRVSLLYVFAYVSGEYCFLQSFTTLFTFIGFISCMSSLMYLKVNTSYKNFTTLLTFTGFLSCMSSLMY